MTKPIPSDDDLKPDLIDGLADGLPPQRRAGYYREMMYCRSLPQSDEMLRILRIMGYLTLMMEEVPKQIAIEREKFEKMLREALEAIRKAGQSAEAYHRQLEERLAGLPSAIAKGIEPNAIAGKINENLRQLFLQSTIPQTADALAVVAREMRSTTAEFSVVARELGGTYRSAATEAHAAVQNIEASVTRAAEGAKRAADNLSWTFSKAYRWSLHSFVLIALILGMLLGMIGERWIYSLNDATEVSAPAPPPPAPASKAVPKTKR